MVVLAKSKNQEAAHKFLNYVLRPDSGKSVTELVLYKTPNELAMKRVKKALAKQYPNLAIPPKKLLTYETERDLGRAQPLWSRTVSEIVG
jgi:spermidine/putrescine transport system substrate-binding protein